MPFISRKQLFNNRIESAGTIVWFHYRRWQHSKNPLVYQIHSDTKYYEGLNVKYLSPQTALKMRETITKLKNDGRRTPKTILNNLKVKHPIAYKRAYRKYFLKYIIVLGRWEVPLIEDQKDKVDKITRQRPEINPNKPGRTVPQGLIKP